MLQYYLPPEIISKCDKSSLDESSKDHLFDIIRHVLCHKDIDLNKVNEIHVKNNQYFFGVMNAENNNIDIVVPINLTYDSGTKLWSTNMNMYLVNDIFLIKYIPIKFTDDQLIYILNHEANHYINGDLSFPNVIPRLGFSLTTNLVVLGLIYYFLGSIYVASALLYNHLYCIYSRNVEKRADLQLGSLEDKKECAKNFWKHVDDAKGEYPKSFTFVRKILSKLKMLYYDYIVGNTHPTLSERIEYFKCFSTAH